MNADEAGMGCTEFRELAPELALGIADGEERAAALAHVNGCADCRRYLEELSTTADELLLLAPSHEPPVGFETRVLGEIRPPARARRWRWRPLPLAASAAAAALATFVGMFFAYRSDHRLADEYRSTLAEANGSYFTAQKLRAPGGAAVGQAFGYDGHPSWVVVTVGASPRQMPAARYDVQLVTHSGRRINCGRIAVDNGNASGGWAIPVSLDRVNEVRLLGPHRGSVIEAPFPAQQD